MEIQRKFVPVGTDPFAGVEYESHKCVITHHVTGAVLFEYEAAVPKHWSVGARDIAISKYFRKGGVPNKTTAVALEHDGHHLPEWLNRREATEGAEVGGEKHVKQVLHRIVGAWAYHGYVNGYFEPSPAQMEAAARKQFGGDPGPAARRIRDENAKAFYDEHIFILLHQMGAPNSPQWFNTGLHWAYGIRGGKGGHFFVNLPHDIRKTEWASNPETAFDVHQDVLDDYVDQTEDSYSRVQAHACFILAVDDTMFNGETGIFEWYNAEGRIFKYGSGSGTNLSNLRAEGEKLSGGGKSSGLMSWMKTADYSAGAIKSGGTTRRAAKMVCLDADHPDILKFIDCKVDSELAVAGMVVGSAAVTVLCQSVVDKVNALSEAARSDAQTTYAQPTVLEAMQVAAEAGVPHSYIDKAVKWALEGKAEWPGKAFTTEYEGEAYTTVPYQNANNSIRLTQEFFDLCDSDGPWKTTWRTTGKTAWEMPAREFERHIAEAAWFCGDPGVQYHTNINDWNVTPNDGQIRASNPCSEHMRQDDTGCNLASLALTRFHVDGRFDVGAYTHAADLYQMMLDITVSMAALPTRGVAKGVFNYRDTGLGYCDLGALLMSMGIAYDSDEGRAVAGALTALLHARAHMTSANMAEALGAYPRFWANKAHHLRCVSNHIVASGNYQLHSEYEGLMNEPRVLDRDALHRGLGRDSTQTAAWLENIDALFVGAYRKAEVFGFRNAEMTVLAPTGTISFIMEADTTGVEPMLAVIAYKTLAGGGTMVVEPSRCIYNGLAALNYSSAQVQKILTDIQHYINSCKESKQRVSADMVQDILRVHVKPEHHAVFDTSLGKYSIRWEAHVLMMAAAQAFLSGAISKTINMPADATVDDIRKAHRMGNDVGIKSLALYRDGSKLSQPMNIVSLAKAAAAVREVVPADKLSPDVPEGGRMLLGWMRNPGVSLKVRLGHGSLYLWTNRYPDGKTAEIWATYSADQGIISALLGANCKMANRMLQWGIPLAEVIDTWADTNFEPKGFVGDHPYIKTATSILNLIARLLDYHELGSTAGLNVQPKANLDAAAVAAVEQEIKTNPEAYGKVKITGETCPQCGSQQFVQSGANCKRCLSCGNAGGCG